MWPPRENEFDTPALHYAPRRTAKKVRRPNAQVILSVNKLQELVRCGFTGSTLKAPDCPPRWAPQGIHVAWSEDKILKITAVLWSGGYATDFKKMGNNALGSCHSQFEKLPTDL